MQLKSNYIIFEVSHNNFYLNNEIIQRTKFDFTVLIFIQLPSPTKK